MRRLLLLPLLAALAAFTASGGLRPPLAGAQDLPAGAKVRLGGGRMVFRGLPFVALLPPDYKTLVTLDSQRNLRKFDLLSGEPLDKDNPGKPITGGQVVVSGDGKRFLSVATGILTIREVDGGKAVQELKPPRQFSSTFTSTVPVVSFSRDGKLLAQGGQSAGAKGSVVVWDVEKGETVFQAPVQHTGPPIPLLSADGKYLATRAYAPNLTGGDANTPTVTVWQVDGGKELFSMRLTGTAVPMTAVAFSPDGGLIAAACGDGPVDVWEVPAGKPKYTLFGRTGQGHRVAFSPDGKTLAAVATDGTIQRWTVADGKLVGTTDGPAALPLAAAQGLAFPANDRVVAWGAAGQAPVAWEAPSGKLLTTLPEHTNGIRSIGFAAGGKEVVTSGQDGRVVRWDAATGKAIAPIELRPSRTLGIGGNRIVVTVSGDGTRGVSLAIPNVVFDLATGAEEFVLPRGPVLNATVYSHLSADASRVVTMAIPYDQKKNGTCTVWDVVDRKKVAQLEMPPGSVQPPAVSFSPDGNRMVTAGYVVNPDGGPQVMRVTGWDLKTGKKLGQVEDMNARGALSVAAASDSFAVVSSTGGRLRAFDFESGKGGDEFEVVNKTDTSGLIVFSPDRKRFVVGTSTTEPGVYAVRVHDWPSGRVLHTFTGHTGQVTALVFSPDGRTLASGSQDGTVVLWDMAAVK